MLSTQDILNTQEIPQTVPEVTKKETGVSANMDCEGFQDLRDWCSAPAAGKIPAHSIIDKDYQCHYENSEEKNMAAIQEAEFFFEDLGLCSSISSPDNSVQTQCQRLLTVQGAINLNIPTDNVTNAVDLDTEDLGLVVFDDLPAYEETIELGPSDENLIVDYADTKYHSEDSGKWGLPNNNIQLNTDTCESETSTYGMKSYDSDVMLSLDIRQSLNKSSTIYDTSYSFNHNINNTVCEDLPLNYESVNFNLSVSSNTKQNNDIIIENIILDHSSSQEEQEPPKLATSAVNANSSANLKLNLNFGNSSLQTSNFVADISTPDVLMAVEQLENDTNYNFKQFANDHPTISYPTASETCIKEEETYTLTPPDTPKWPSRKRRRDSEDSDASYIPPTDSHKKSRKPSASRSKDIMEIINTPAKRGRPPKHRDSISSNGTCYTDDRSAASSPGDKYRERRDKNNEASRRSRYNRKMKDSEMVTFADDLECRNNELRITVAKLERQKQILREVLLKSVSNKQT